MQNNDGTIQTRLARTEFMGNLIDGKKIDTYTMYIMQCTLEKVCCVFCSIASTNH